MCSQTASMISGGQRRPEQGIAEGAGLPFERIPSRERFGAGGQRIRPSGGVIVAPGRRFARIFRIARLVAIEPVDAAGRVVPGDGEADTASFAGRQSQAARERAVLGLTEHVLCGARLRIASLA